MTEKNLNIQTLPLFFSWFQRSAAYCVACIGYLIGLFLVQHTPLSIFLLTAIYSLWIVVFYHLRQQHAYSLILFALACASLFIPLPSANAYWLPILPTMTACVMTTKRPLLTFLAACLLWIATGLAITLITQQWNVGSQIILLISFASTYGCTATIHELKVAHLRLQEYSAQAEELSIIRERNRIAREIHDTLGHTLALLSVLLETATQFEARGDSRFREKLQAAQHVAKNCLSDVRHSVEALRPDETSSPSLYDQLLRLQEDFSVLCQKTSITLDLEEATHPLTPELALTLYRCAQEALTNIRKHAQATKVLLRLSTTNVPLRQVELTVLDNGQGASSPDQSQSSGFGLIGMRERVDLLHGSLEAGPEPGHGWRVEVLLPLPTRTLPEKTPTNTSLSMHH